VHPHTCQQGLPALNGHHHSGERAKEAQQQLQVPPELPVDRYAFVVLMMLSCNALMPSQPLRCQEPGGAIKHSPVLDDGFDIQLVAPAGCNDLRLVAKHCLERWLEAAY